jgi:transposase
MEIQFAALVAIDWADQAHVWAMEIAGQEKLHTGSFAHTPECVEVWAAGLAERFSNQLVAVAIEQSRGPLVFMLAKYSHLVIFPVHSSTLANYRKSFHPSGAKDDPLDARLLLDILARHREKLRPLRPDTVETRTIHFLVEERRKIVDQKTACTNRLTAHLKMYFPQALNWFGEIGSPIAVAFLERWPTLAAIQKARTTTIRQFYTSHNSRTGGDCLDKRVEEIRKAIPATNDQAVVTGYSVAVLAWIGFLKQLLLAIKDYDQRIEALAKVHPDYALMKSFPGVGPVIAPRLIAALGSQRDRYESAYQIQCYSGIAPVVSASGKKHHVHCRWACPAFLRQTFHEWAQHSMVSSRWARDYYERQREKRKSHNTAVRALAFKWIRILFRCWKNNVPYNELVYTKSVASHSQQEQPVKTVEIKWEKKSGFKKLIAPAS